MEAEEAAALPSSPVGLAAALPYSPVALAAALPCSPVALAAADSTTGPGASGGGPEPRRSRADWSAARQRATGGQGGGSCSK